jgi:hypothetical protein
MKKRGSTAHNEANTHAEAAKPHGSTKAGKYRLLYEYLENRYAQTVVLTFQQNGPAESIGPDRCF